jgi:glycosyltransferase involved in cell wall biosynthesis
MERSLSKCLDSILSQTYSEYETILIDDGSQDQSWKICQEYMLKFPKIKAFHQPNSGVSSARNKGLTLAKGEWIAFVDPDDYIASDYLETLFNNSLESDFDIISSCCLVEFENETKKPDFFWSSDFDCCSDKEKIKILLQIIDPKIGQPGRVYTAFGVPWGKLYRSQMITEYNLAFFPELTRMQDNIFNLYAVHAAKKIRYINTPKYIYCLKHIKNYSKQFNEEYTSIINCFLKARYDFFYKSLWMEDLEIRQTFLKNSEGLIYSVIARLLFVRSYKISINERIKRVTKFYQQDYIENIENELKNCKNKSIKKIIIKFLVGWIMKTSRFHE